MTEKKKDDEKEEKSGWIALDLDGTLAEYYEGQDLDEIGRPIPLMLKRVFHWLDEGEDVRIFTARAADSKQIKLVEDWCEEYIGEVLPVTNEKDHEMKALWDDRAVGVETNTGIVWNPLSGDVERLPDIPDDDEEEENKADDNEPEENDE